MGAWPNVAQAGLLTNTGELHRVTQIDDGAGGHREVREPLGDHTCKIAEPSAEEREVAAAEGITLDAMIYFSPGTDIRRNDVVTDVLSTEPRQLGETWRVAAVSRPSERDSYVRARCTNIRGGS